MGRSRFLVSSAFLLCAFAGAAGCGGSSVKHVGDGEAGENAGGKGSTGGSNTTGGTSGKAGTTGGTSTGGTSGTSGTSGTGGSLGGGTTAGTAGSTGGTNVGGTGATSGCGPIPPCDPIDCPGGDYAEPVCGGCPVCCALVDCALADCQDGEVAVRLPGNCCETCVPATSQGCENVMCPGQTECDPDSTWRREAGACCASCVPLEGPACLEIACPDLDCAPGFAPGDGANGCCYECVPDPLYCSRNSDCLLAVHVGDDCACQGAISWREFNDDVCWESKDSGRTAPTSCGESGACPCPYGGNYAVCNDNSQCQQITVSLK